jgi:HD-GYP domain-containing protein (c-di-GMP phosphodiesterase class II)
VNAPLRDPSLPNDDARALRGAEERTRRLGHALVPKLSAVLRGSHHYAPDNQVFHQQLIQVIDVVWPLLEQHGEAALVALDNDLYLNGVRIPAESHELRFHRHVFEELQRRRIAGLRMLRGVTPRDLGVLLRLFIEPDIYHGAELVHACLARGADHLQPVVHATTDKPADDFEYEHEDAAPAAAGGGADRIVQAVSPAPVAGTDADEARETDGATPAADAAHGTYANAVDGARALLSAAALESGMAVRHAKRVVQPMVDALLSDAVVGIGPDSQHDASAAAHTVNVTRLTIAMGRLLGLERRELADLGAAALLHDAGQATVGSEVRHPVDRYDDADWAAIRRHPIEGLKTIARSGALDPTTLRCMRVALEHHMGPGETGYPAMAGPWATSAWSRLVSVADAFVSLQTHRGGAGVTPHLALGMMLGPLRDRFDPVLLWVLVESVGFYPPGQRVELDDHSVALVLAPQPDDPARPHVRLLTDAHGVTRAGEPIELHPLPSDRSILRALPPGDDPAEPFAAAA